MSRGVTLAVSISASVRGYASNRAYYTEASAGKPISTFLNKEFFSSMGFFKPVAVIVCITLQSLSTSPEIACDRRSAILRSSKFDCDGVTKVKRTLN